MTPSELKTYVNENRRVTLTDLSTHFQSDPQAVKAATLIPAQVLGLEKEIGSIAPGKRADLVVLDENLDIAAVYH